MWMTNLLRFKYEGRKEYFYEMWGMKQVIFSFFYNRLTIFSVQCCRNQGFQNISLVNRHNEIRTLLKGFLLSNSVVKISDFFRLGFKPNSMVNTSNVDSITWKDFLEAAPWWKKFLAQHIWDHIAALECGRGIANAKWHPSKGKYVIRRSKGDLS